MNNDYFEGKAEISSREYRELIESALNSENSLAQYRNESWKKDSEIRELKDKIEQLETQVRDLNRAIEIYNSMRKDET